MGNAAALRLGKDEAPVTVGVSVEGVLKEVSCLYLEVKSKKP